MAKKELTYEAIREAMRDMDYAALMKLHRECGVPFFTLLKIRDGVTKDPKLSTALMLWSALK